MKRGFFVVLLVLSSTACGLASIRTSEMGELTPDAMSERRGRELLESALAASGGRACWDSYPVAELTLQDEWRGFIGPLFRPWPGNPTRLQMHYELDMRAVEATILSEKKRGLRFTQHDKEKYRFILAAYQYFFELPRNAVDLPIVTYAGHRRREGRDFDLVFATWGTIEAHREDDQYLFWIARDTHLMERVQYTIRDKVSWAKGVNFFSDFRTVDGLTLPHRYTIFRHLNDHQWVHRAQIENLHFRNGDRPVACGSVD